MSVDRGADPPDPLSRFAPAGNVTPFQVNPVRTFLSEHLGLSLQEGKTRIFNTRCGVPFLGAYLKPRRSYVSNFTLRRMGGKISLLERTLSDPDPDHLRSSMSSMLGLMRQHSSHRLRLDLTGNRLKPFLRYGRFDEGLTRFIPEVERSFFNRLISTGRRWPLRPVL